MFGVHHGQKTWCNQFDLSVYCYSHLSPNHTTNYTSGLSSSIPLSSPLLVNTSVAKTKEDQTSTDHQEILNPTTLSFQRTTSVCYKHVSSPFTSLRPPPFRVGRPALVDFARNRPPQMATVRRRNIRTEATHDRIQEANSTRQPIRRTTNPARVAWDHPIMRPIAWQIIMPSPFYTLRYCCK